MSIRIQAAVWLLSGVCAMPALGQVFFGLDHAGQGAARITPGAGEITVDGFGPTGSDGIFIDPGIAECIELGVNPGDVASYPDGSELSFVYDRSDADGGSAGYRETIRVEKGNPLYQGQTVKGESAIYGGKNFIGAEGMRVRVLRQGQVVHEESYDLPYADPVLAGFTLPDGTTLSGCCVDPCTAGKTGGQKARHDMHMGTIQNIKAIAADGGETDVDGDQIQIDFEYPAQATCACDVDRVGIFGRMIPSVSITGETLVFGRAKVETEGFNVKQEFGPISGTRRMAMGGGTGTATVTVESADAALVFPSSVTDPFLDPGADASASVSIGMDGLDTLTFSTAQGVGALTGITMRPFQERDLVLYSGGSIVASETVPAGVDANVGGISRDGDLTVSGGGFASSAKIVTPFTDVTDGGWQVSFAPSLVSLPSGTTELADSIRVQCPTSTPMLCPDGTCRESKQDCAAAIPPAVMEISDPSHEIILGEVIAYDPFPYADTGEPASSGGFFEIGDSVCIEIPDSNPTGIVWTKDGEVLAGATGRRICIEYLLTSDSGTYRASYDDGSKAPATYEFTMTVAESLPVAWWAVALGLFALLAMSIRVVRSPARQLVRHD